MISEVMEIRTDLQRMTRTLEGLRDSMTTQELSGWLVHYPRPMELSEAFDFVVAETPADNREAMPLPAWPVIFLVCNEGRVSINDRQVLQAGESELIADLTGQSFVRALDHPTKVFFIAPKAKGYAGGSEDRNRTTAVPSAINGTTRGEG